MFQSWFFLSKSWKHGVVCFVFRREMDLIWLLDIFCGVFTWWRHRLHRIWFQYFLDSWHLSVIVPAWSLRYCSVSVAWSMENFHFNSPFTGSKELWWLENHGVFISLCLIWGIIKRQWAYPNPPKAGVISWDRLVADLIFKGPMPGKNPYNWLMLNWMLLVLQPCWYAMGWWQRKIPGCFVKDLKELKWPRFEMMNNCWKLCDLKTGDHVAILQLLSFGKCSCLKNTSVKMFFPTKLRRCIKDGYGTKVCTTSRVVFDVYFFAHLIWEANLSVFASPGIRSTLAMDTSSGTLLEVWMGWFFIGGWDLPTTSNERSTRSR